MARPEKRKLPDAEDAKITQKKYKKIKKTIQKTAPKHSGRAASKL
jgi:hypothetical protein